MHEALPPAVDGCPPPDDEVSDELEPFSDYDRGIAGACGRSRVLDDSSASTAGLTGSHG